MDVLVFSVSIASAQPQAAARVGRADPTIAEHNAPRVKS